MSAPNVITIPLPPGFTISDYAKLQQLAASLRIVTVLAFGLALWDYFVLLPKELLLYRKMTRATFLSVPFWMFLLVRYLSLAALIGGIMFANVTVSDCQAIATFAYSLAVVITAATALLFLFRVRAIWDRSVPITIMMSVMYVILVGSWIAVTPGYRLETGPPQLSGGNCMHPSTYTWSPLNYVASVIFDVMVVVLSTMRLRTTDFGVSQISSQMMKDGLLYFIVVTVANCVSLALQFLPSTTLMEPYHAVPVPLNLFILMAMSSRVFLNLRTVAAQRQGSNERYGMSSFGYASNGLRAGGPNSPRHPFQSGQQSGVFDGPKDATHLPYANDWNNNQQVHVRVDRYFERGAHSPGPLMPTTL